MRSILILLATDVLFLASLHGQDCACETPIGDPLAENAGTYFGASHGQLYPYDRQDPWLHGNYQRVPSYGGMNSFRPYNYRHLAPQAQIAARWGATQGLSYSQQYWNRHRENYLNGGLHARNPAVPPSSGVMSFPSNGAQRVVAGQVQNHAAPQSPTQLTSRPRVAAAPFAASPSAVSFQSSALPPERVQQRR